MKKLVLVMIFVCNFSYNTFSQDFVRVERGQFYRGDDHYKFLGANYWYGMYLGMASTPGNRERLIRELDYLQSLGINNLRVLGSSEGEGKYQITPTLLNAEGQYNEEVFEGLDFLFVELGKRKMTAVVVLNNFWMWSGGMPQYVSWVKGTEIPLPDIENGSSWDPFINYSLKFFENKKAQRLYLNHLKKFVGRKNSISGIQYKDDPTIMAWQLANEPRGYTKQKQYRAWIEKTSSYLSKKDKKHMISLGAEGNTSSDHAGIDLFLDNQFDEIDYATIHLWIQNWGWYDPNTPDSFEESLDKASEYIENQLAKAKQLNKPVVIEEFGVSRDQGNFNVHSETQYRDRFYQFVFDVTYKNMLNKGLIQGCNFWSWGGEGRPAHAGGMWQAADDLIGDPPHEKQGWYTVYDHDTSTIDIIRESASLINQIKDER